MYHPKSLRVRQAERLWGRKKGAIEQPNLLKIVKTALFHPTETDTTVCIESSQNQSCRYYLVQAGPIQHRFCLNPPPPPSEAPNSTTLNYFLIELAKHLRNKWLTNHLKSRYCLRMRKLINPRELYRYTPTNQKHQHLQ